MVQEKYKTSLNLSQNVNFIPLCLFTEFISAQSLSHAWNSGILQINKLLGEKTSFAIKEEQWIVINRHARDSKRAPNLCSSQLILQDSATTFYQSLSDFPNPNLIFLFTDHMSC